MSDEQRTHEDDHRLTGPGTILSLIVATGFVVGVMISARIAYDHAEHRPITLNAIDAPGASSNECSRLVDNLPDSLGSFDRVPVAQPAPAGAAVWVKGDKRVTLRCGVQPPDSYTALSTTEQHGKDDDHTMDTGPAAEIRWLGVADTVGGDVPVSGTVTWYTLGRSQEVAVTGPASMASELKELARPLRHNPVSPSSATAHPAPAPLSALPADDSDPLSAQCRSVLDALPSRFGALTRTTKDVLGHDLPQGVVAWIAPRREPVVVRCGVHRPASYKPGAQLQQINDVPWFNADVSHGQPEMDEPGPQDSTSRDQDRTWYALGYRNTVALSMPASSGNGVITTVSDAIARHVEKSSD